MSTLGWRLAVLSLMLGLAIGYRIAWLWQAKYHTQQLAEQELAHVQARAEAAGAAFNKLQAVQAERSALEQRLQAQSTSHYKELKDAQDARRRLVDRLATADLRLSLLTVNPDACVSGNGGVSAAAGTGCMVHGASRAELDPAHARRIIAITGDGDDGLRALNACQSYVRSLLLTNKN